MRPIALTVMLFSWLIYSTMAAWAGCPTCVSMAHAASMDMAGVHHEMSGMEMGDGTAKAKDPCSTSGMAHTPFCAACLILPPEVVVYSNARPAHGYAQPLPGKRLSDNRPAPLAPPPRSI